jgi:hypothetical protein
MNSRLDITQEQVRSLLHYDPETGVFTWLRRDDAPFNGRFAGKRADTLRHDGYTRIRLTLNGGFYGYMAHRLAWLYVHGSFPKQGTDHINRIRNDNRIANLREASQSQNGCNTPKRKTNKSGEKGVVYVGKINQRNPWCAFIQLNKKMKNLGYFPTKEEAAAAYKVASLELHGEFSTYAQASHKENVNGPNSHPQGTNTICTD